MKYKTTIFSLLLLSGLGFSGLQAQEAITVGGGEASGAGGSVSYSVGQVNYLTLTGTNGSVSQGVQQPYEISVVTGLEEAKNIELVCSIYPNPTTNLLQLKVKDNGDTNLSYQLFDINGILLKSEKLTGDQTTISLGNLISATYFLKVIDNKIELKTFKIIKR